MTDEQYLYRKLGIVSPEDALEKKDPENELETFKREFGRILSKRFKQAVNIKKLGDPEEIFEKYRKNTSAAMIDPLVDLTEKHRFEHPILMVKHYLDGCSKNFNSDVSMMDALYGALEPELKEINDYRFTGKDVRRKIGSFMRPWSYDNEYFRQKRILITDLSQDAPFDKQFSGDRKENVFGFTGALDPVIILHEMIPWFENRIPKIKEIMAESISLEDYVSSFCTIVDTADALSEGQKTEIKAGFKELARVYLTGKEMETLIQYDGYPWHHDNNYFLDIGNLKRGARGMHLGALFGHPLIFSRMDNPEKVVYDLVVDSYDKFKRYEYHAQFPSASNPFTNLDPNILENSFYVGAICANSNLLVDYATRLNKREINDLETVMHKQFEILKNKDHPKGVMNACSQVNLGDWNYRENLADRVKSLNEVRKEDKK